MSFNQSNVDSIFDDINCNHCYNLNAITDWEPYARYSKEQMERIILDVAADSRNRSRYNLNLLKFIYRMKYKDYSSSIIKEFTKSKSEAKFKTLFDSTVRRVESQNDKGLL